MRSTASEVSSWDGERRDLRPQAVLLLKAFVEKNRAGLKCAAAVRGGAAIRLEPEIEFSRSLSGIGRSPTTVWSPVIEVREKEAELFRGRHRYD